MLTKIISSFEVENMQTQYSVLSYRINLRFHDYKLAIEIDQNGHSNKNFVVSLLELILTKNILIFFEQRNI